MIKKALLGASRFNKATAAVVSQALVQLLAVLVPFEPELEQAVGIMLTALLVWLVPNRKRDAIQSEAAVHEGSPVAHLPAPLAILGLALAILAGGCALLGSGNPIADEVLGRSCGPESRVLRARLVAVGLSKAHPGLAMGSVWRALEGMDAAADAGQPLTRPAAAFENAVAQAVAPVFAEAGFGEEPVWVSLSRLPALAAEVLLVRRHLAEFCAPRQQPAADSAGLS